MCLSALEIGRRGYAFNHQYLLKDKDIEKNIVLNNSQKFISNAKQSLEELGLHLDVDLVDLKQIFKEVKNSKLRYRVQLDENQCCFRKLYLTLDSDANQLDGDTVYVNQFENVGEEERIEEAHRHARHVAQEIFENYVSANFLN